MSRREYTVGIKDKKTREETGLRKCYRVRAFNYHASVYSRCVHARACDRVFAIEPFGVLARSPGLCQAFAI